MCPTMMKNSPIQNEMKYRVDALKTETFGEEDEVDFELFDDKAFSGDFFDISFSSRNKKKDTQFARLKETFVNASYFFLKDFFKFFRNFFNARAAVT